MKFKLQLGRVKEIGPHSSSYTPRNATNWHGLQSGTLLRFTVTYVALTTLKWSAIAMPTSTGLLPMKTWIGWPVWTFTNFILKFLNFTTMRVTVLKQRLGTVKRWVSHHSAARCRIILYQNRAKLTNASPIALGDSWASWEAMEPSAQYIQCASILCQWNTSFSQSPHSLQF